VARKAPVCGGLKADDYVVTLVAEFPARLWQPYQSAAQSRLSRDGPPRPEQSVAPLSS
jgi:hypothetical protein